MYVKHGKSRFSLAILLIAGFHCGAGFSFSQLQPQQDTDSGSRALQPVIRKASSALVPITNVHSASGEQLLVLKNGNVIRGFVEKQSGKYSIQTRQGSRVFVFEKDADFVCSSLQEAYWGKLARLKSTDINRQVSLFHWCVRNQIFELAANQIEVLKVAEVDQKQITFLNTQLTNAIVRLKKSNGPKIAANSNHINNLQPTKNSKQENSAATALSHQANQDSTTQSKMPEGIASNIPSAKMVSSTAEFFDNVDPVFKPLPSFIEDLPSMKIANSIPASNPAYTIDENGDPVFETIRSPDESPSANPPSDSATQIALVGYEKSIAANGNSSTTQPKRSAAKETAPSVAAEPVVGSQPDPRTVGLPELDKLAREMPQGSFGAFRGSIEKILIQKCSNCHDMNSDVMPLMHRGFHQPLTRRMTERNLFSAMQYIDKNNPLKSRILIAATNAHGGADVSGVQPDSKFHEAFAKWLVTISNEPNDVVVPVKPHPTDTSPDNKNVKPLKAALNAGSAFEDESNTTDATSIQRPFDSEPIPGLTPTIGEIPSIEDAPIRFTPKDEFDPEIFNRQTQIEK